MLNTCSLRILDHTTRKNRYFLDVDRKTENKNHLTEKVLMLIGSWSCQSMPGPKRMYVIEKGPRCTLEEHQN